MARGKRKRREGTQVEVEEEEAGQRGWFFCACRQSSAVTAKAVRRSGWGQEKDGHSQQWKFHGARPLGASGESRVSGPWQWGQVKSGVGSIVFTASRLSLLVVAESSCLAFSSS